MSYTDEQLLKLFGVRFKREYNLPLADGYAGVLLIGKAGEAEFVLIPFKSEENIKEFISLVAPMMFPTPDEFVNITCAAALLLYPIAEEFKDAFEWNSGGQQADKA